MTDQAPLELETSAVAADAQTSAGYRVVVNGQVDAASAPQLKAALDALIEQGATLIVLDSAHIHFMDSSGLRVIISCGQVLEAAGGRLLIEGASGAMQRVLEISGLMGKYTS